jgi:toxin YoeB
VIISFDPVAFLDYNSWAAEDSKVSRRIGELIRDICRDPFKGLGKPEPLKQNLAGYWSRRITDEHRPVYKYTDKAVYIVSCKFHY